MLLSLAEVWIDQAHDGTSQPASGAWPVNTVGVGAHAQTAVKLLGTVPADATNTAKHAHITGVRCIQT